jgi:CRISPR-associated endoribonuclease Cas6
MKVKITFTSNSPVELPIHYNHILQGFIYRTMDSIYSNFFHNAGFPYGKRLYKLLTFSRIFGKNKVLKKTKKVAFFPPIYFYFSCYLRQATASYVRNLIKGERFNLGKNTVYLEGVEVLTEKVTTNSATVKTISPVTIHSTPKTGRVIFHNPFENTFYRLLSENLLKKAKVAGLDAANSVKVLPHPRSSFKRAVVLYKTHPVQAWKGLFIITAPAKVIELALLAGVGDRNSQGFGMVILETS